MSENLPEVIEEKEIQIIQQSPMELAQSFLAGGGNLENLEKMLELQEKYDAMQAKKAYTKAMAEFKTIPLVITKDKFNSQYNSKYTSVGNLVNSALPGMSKCGLSHKWEFEQTDPKMITGTCTVTHSDGHSESVSIPAPIDTSGSKNQLQQFKSTRTYLRIETFESIMGIASSDGNIDDDGNSAGIKLITEEQAIEIQEAIDSIDGFSIEEFLKWAKVDSVENIHLSNLGKVKTALKTRSQQ